MLDRCLEFSPYTHFYNQLLVDVIIKTYNMNFIRLDILIKNDIKFEDLKNCIVISPYNNIEELEKVFKNRYNLLP